MTSYHMVFKNGYFGSINKCGGLPTHLPEIWPQIDGADLAFLFQLYALVELKEIKQELAKFQPSDVIWDIEDLSARPPWGDDISPDITNLSNYFVTSDGEDFLLILQHALEKAWECGGDLVIKSM